MFGTVVGCIVEDGQQQVLFLNVCRSVHTCLKHSQLKDIAGFLIEHQLMSVYRHTKLILPYSVLEFGLYVLKIKVQTVEGVNHHTVLHPQQTKQQVFRPY